MAWLAQLYASTRAEEMALVPWPEAIKRNFLEQQFALQHRHYLTHYGEAKFQIVECSAQRVGRYYLLCTPPDHLLVDISLLPEWRNQGIGSALIQCSQIEAQRLGCGMHLHVLKTNHRALQLYQRLGFVIQANSDTHWHLRWRTVSS